VKNDDANIRPISAIALTCFSMSNDAIPVVALNALSLVTRLLVEIGRVQLSLSNASEFLGYILRTYIRMYRVTCNKKSKK
jgi:hypothetical protein